MPVTNSGVPQARRVIDDAVRAAYNVRRPATAAHVSTGDARKVALHGRRLTGESELLRIAAAALAVFVLVGSATLIQFAWAERTEAIQTRRADCFGFGATDTDDLAYVNIFNSLQQP